MMSMAALSRRAAALPVGSSSSSSSSPFLRTITTVAQRLNTPLSQLDTEVDSIITREKERQKLSINLIPSENFTSQAVLDALGSVMQNKYSEVGGSGRAASCRTSTRR